MQSFISLDYEQQIASYKQAATIALKAYDVALEAISIEPISLVNNATFKVLEATADGVTRQFALRIHRPDGEKIEAIRSELLWLQAIRRNTTLKTPHPVPTISGEPLVSVSLTGLKDVLNCVLFEWLEGDYLRTSEQTPESSYQVGQFAGALHQQSSQFSSTSGLVRRRLDGNSIFDRSILTVSVDRSSLFTQEHIQIFQQVEERTQTVFGKLDQDHQTFGLIHSDLIWKNYFFHETGVGALDFDSCSWGYFLYDLAPTLLGYRDESGYPDLRKACLSGYRSVRHLPAQHEQYLDTLIAARHLISCVWLAGHLDNPDLRQNASSIIAYRISEMCDLIE
ncbi:MAG: phosphotransferase [Candidatus Latescibacteria bacterium]|nr:phosphotransferase [Candidatus Latescibacterota bacterium]